MIRTNASSPFRTPHHSSTVRLQDNYKSIEIENNKFSMAAAVDDDDMVVAGR